MWSSLDRPRATLRLALSRGQLICRRVQNDRNVQSAGFLLRALSLMPPLTAFAVFYLFAGIPQMQEVYLGILEQSDLARGLAGLALVSLLSALFYVWHYWLGTRSLDLVYPSHADIHVDSWLIGWRNRKALAVAALPLAGVALGLYFAVSDSIAASEKFARVITTIGDKSSHVEFAPTLELLGAIRSNAWTSGAIVFAVTTIGLLSIHFTMRRLRFGHWLRLGVTGTSAVVTLAIAIVPLIVPDRIVAFARTFGPLAAVALTLIGFVMLFMTVSATLKWLGPTLTKGGATLLAILIPCWLLYQGLGRAPPPRVAVHSDETPAPHNFTNTFKTWLLARADRDAYRQAGKPYPVFLFATSGGGIYAASASAAFLAAMQDQCPNFAQHVFAISGVSGGAVGASIFTAMVKDNPDRPAPNGQVSSASPCPIPTEQTPRPYSAATQSILVSDHLSPVIGLIAPDFIRKLYPVNDQFDRSNILERSFACSFDIATSAVGWRKANLDPTCGRTSRGGGLRVPLEEYWSVNGATPAAILNTTWADKGFRVAFAPFGLREIGDGTLFNFHFKELPLDETKVPASLVEGAFVSARFPLIAPARRIPSTSGNQTGNTVLEWNFVDGGYVDNSGSTTALELYKRIDAIIEADKLQATAAVPPHAGLPKIDLRLVLLTDAEVELDYSKIKGTTWQDTIAPVSALLSVRSQLSQRAVTRAIETLEPGASQNTSQRSAVVTRTRASADHKLLIVDIEQQTFSLPLGWKMSKVTNDIVSLMMGRPELCPIEPRGPPVPGASDKSAEIKGVLTAIEQNSCVKRRLVNLLTMAPVTN